MCTFKMGSFEKKRSKSAEARLLMNTLSGMLLLILVSIERKFSKPLPSARAHSSNASITQ